MDWYTLLKFVHIVAAMAWLGGSLAMLVASALVAREPDPLAPLHFMALSNALSLPYFMPASLTVLASGLAMTALWFGLSQAWLLLALCGIGISISIGAAIIKPAGERITRRAAIEGLSVPVRGEMHRLTRIVRFDNAVLLAILALMVFKPGWQDAGMLLSLSLVVAIAAAVFLIPLRPRVVPAAP